MKPGRKACGCMLVLAFLTLAGCASDPRFSQGLEWVQWQEAERKRLDAAGFPQYTGAQ